MALNEKQVMFVREYLVDLNATNAAIRAGYSEKTAYSQGQRLLKHVEIGEAIAKASKERIERVQIDADYVLRRLVEVDQMDVADIMDDDGNVLPVKEWPKVWRQYISGMDVSEIWDNVGDERKMTGMLKKIKWPDKLKNLELLGKHVDIQAWKERVEHDATDKLADAIMNARRRERHGE